MTRSHRTPATTTLIALILGVFVVEILLRMRMGVHLAWLFAVVPDAVHAGQYWRLVTGMFLHAGPLHLFLNTVALFQLGRFYELMFGTRRFLLVYFATGIAASLASTWYNTGPSVGASGAILGILGAFVFSVRRSPLWRHNRMARSIVSQGVFWIVANLVITWTVPQIDKAGHIGGIASGLILGWLLPHRAPPPPPAAMVVDVTPYEESAAGPEARTDDRSPRE